MDVTSVLITILLSLVLLIYWYIRKSFSYWKSMGVPHEEPEIPYGNVRGLGKTANMYSITERLYKKFKGTCKLFGIYLFIQPNAVIMDLDLIKTILVKEFSTFCDRDFFHNEKVEPLSGHLVALNGDRWRHVRTKLTPTFTSGKMKYMFPTISKVGDRLIQFVHDTIKQNDEIEVKRVLGRFTMDVIGTVAFGIECDTMKSTDNEFYRLSRIAMEQTRHGPYMMFLIRNLKGLARILGVKILRDDVSEFFMNVVKSTIEYRQKNDIQRNDFMDLLIKLKTDEKGGKSNDGLTENEIAAQAFLFFLAGYETSSTTMLFTLYELALNPDIQIKVRQEIRRALEKHGDITYEMMIDIPYLDQVINETLRKYPPFTIVVRMAGKDYKVPDTHIVLKKGVPIFISVYAIHHDAEYFPDPKKFDPDRFTPEEVKKRHPFAWLPFGEGPRNCIGLRFGMMQARIGLIKVLLNFKFTPCAKTQVPVVFGASPIVLGPKDGIHLKIEPIEAK